MYIRCLAEGTFGIQLNAHYTQSFANKQSAKVLSVDYWLLSFPRESMCLNISETKRSCHIVAKHQMVEYLASLYLSWVNSPCTGSGMIDELFLDARETRPLIE
jgi:hypothetical protein